MERKSLLIALMIIMPASHLLARNPAVWAGDLKPRINNNWTIGLQAGFMSYFGDLSLYDKVPVKKIRFESDFAGGMIITKNLGRAFGVSGQLHYGHFHSDKYNNSYFTTEIIEYSLTAKFDLLKMIYRKHTPRTGVYGFAGIGQFTFKTKSYEQTEGGSKITVHNTGVPEFVWLSGGGIDYRVTQSMRLMAELSVRQAQNDKLDNVIKNNNPDYYSLFSIGISWNFTDILNPFNRPAEKAYRDMGLTKRR